MGAIITKPGHFTPKATDLSAAFKADKKKLVWAVIQVAHGKEENGEWVACDDWDNRLETDLPEWVKDEEVMGVMMGGDMVSKNKEKGGMWYRAALVTPPTIQ